MIIDVDNDGTKNGLCGLKRVIGDVFSIVFEELFSLGFKLAYICVRGACTQIY